MLLPSAVGVVLASAAGLAAVVLGWFVARSFRANAEEHTDTEAADIEEIRRDILLLQATTAADQHRPLVRGTHAKGTSVAATFEVFDLERQITDSALAGRLAQGIFSKAGVYHAIVRFANGNSQLQSDFKRDVRGCSFSVTLPRGTFGPTVLRQDFAMNNAHVFALNDAHAFAVTGRVVTASNGMKALWGLSLSDKAAFLRAAVLGFIEEHPPKASYQRTRFWSGVPYSHGPIEAIKYSLLPRPTNASEALGAGPDALQDELLRHVRDDHVMSSWDFAIQLLDVDKMRAWGRRRDREYWIENASVAWEEAQAPFHVVGRLTLLRGSALSAREGELEYIDVTENALPATKPLGSINRARWVAESSSRRSRLAAEAPGLSTAHDAD